MCYRDVEKCDKFSLLTDETSSIKLQLTHKKMSGIRKMKICFMQTQYINLRIGIHMYQITLHYIASSLLWFWCCIVIIWSIILSQNPKVLQNKASMQIIMFDLSHQDNGTLHNRGLVSLSKKWLINFLLWKGGHRKLLERGSPFRNESDWMNLLTH